MDTSIQKSVELGVDEIQPVYSTHSIPALKGDRATRKLQHWQAIATSAVEQSGRSVIPTLQPAQPLSQWLTTTWPELKALGALGRILDPTATQRLIEEDRTDRSNINRYVILIGPETGFTSEEVEAVTREGFVAVRFGPRILRTETAGPAVLATLQALSGDLLA